VEDGVAYLLVAGLLLGLGFGAYTGDGAGGDGENGFIDAVAGREQQGEALDVEPREPMTEMR
jgi:hypothetical protein